MRRAGRGKIGIPDKRLRGQGTKEQRRFKKLEQLDDWLRVEIPTQLSERDKEPGGAFLTKKEVEKMSIWKISAHTYRPVPLAPEHDEYYAHVQHV